jgi:two-component system sensor histidine kinase UhpB
VVEDNPTDALLLQEALAEFSGTDFQTTCVERLADALARLTAAKFDVVLLDLSLPDSQGPDTLTRLHLGQPGVPVVVLTGLNDETVGIRAVQLGAQDYLVKGHSPAGLLGRSIRYAIERHNIALALRDSEARLSALIRSAMDSIIAVDQQKLITLFNPAAEYTFGWTAREMLGQTCDRLIPARFRGVQVSPPRLFGQIDVRGWKMGDLEFISGLRANGKEFPMEASISQVEVAGQKLILAILRDVSDRKRAEEAMMAQFKESVIAEERNRMAREIHDTLAQGFAGVIFQLESARDLNAESPEEANKYMERAEALARTNLAQARSSVWALRPPELDAKGLAGAIQVFIDRIAAGSSTRVEFSILGKPRPLTNLASIELLRICQEAVLNALRHAQSSLIHVQITYQPSDVTLCVHDNGRGLDLLAAKTARGFGLTSMRERAERTGAQLTIVGKPGEGTRITVVAPSAPAEMEFQAP